MEALASWGSVAAYVISKVEFIILILFLLINLVYFILSVNINTQSKSDK